MTVVYNSDFDTLFVSWGWEHFSKNASQEKVFLPFCLETQTVGNHTTFSMLESYWQAP